MTCYICETCGTQYDNSVGPPAQCPVCEDDRQYVGWQGQSWTTHAALATRHRVRLADDFGVLGLGLAPSFAIDQRAFFLPTDAGNLLWECLSLVTDEAVARLRALGGIRRIAISHPHFYGSMIEWSRTLGDIPVLVHEADRDWVRRPASVIEFWSGDSLHLSDAVTLIGQPHTGELV